MSINELTPIISAAWEASPLVEYALIENYLYNQAIVVDQSRLLTFISSCPYNINPEALQKAALTRIDHDIAITAHLNEAIAYTQLYGEEDLTYSLQTNKMDKALMGAREIIADPISFDAIIHGEYPFGFENDPAFPLIIGETDTLFGNSNITYLNTALIEVGMSLLGPDAKIQDLSFSLGKHWLDHSPMTHITPVNSAVFEGSDFLKEEYKNNYSFSFHDDTTPLGFVFVHSGYAFGGYRDEDRYKDGKLFGPEDCSSWISKLCNCDIEFSTIDLLYTYRAQVEGNLDYIAPDWVNSRAATALFETFSPVKIIDPFTDIQPGQILVFRKFETADHTQDAGMGGHVALVLGVTEEGQVVTLNYQRDMPDKEGFGIGLFDAQSDDTKEVFFLKVNQVPLSLEDVFPVSRDDLCFWEGTSLPLPLPTGLESYAFPVFDLLPSLNELEISLLA